MIPKGYPAKDFFACKSNRIPEFLRNFYNSPWRHCPSEMPISVSNERPDQGVQKHQVGLLRKSTLRLLGGH